MDHVVIPLDEDHRRSVVELAADLVAASGCSERGGSLGPHVTVVGHTGLGEEDAHRAVVDAVAGLAPFVVHAHGYGMFTGEGPRDLSIHVPIVRTRALDELHRRVFEALRTAGAEVAGWTDPDHWTPHMTLVDRGLDAAGLGACAELLAHRRHPSWHLAVDRVLLAGGWAEQGGATEVRLGG